MRNHGIAQQSGVFTSPIAIPGIMPMQDAASYMDSQAHSQQDAVLASKVCSTATPTVQSGLRAWVLPGDGMQLRIQLQRRERLQAAVDVASSGGVPQQGAYFRCAHVPEPV